MKRKRYLFAFGLALLLMLLGSSARSVPPAQALSRSVTKQVIRSVVQIIAVDVSSSGRLQPKWTGSGTIISKDGLILTNCHVALPSAMFKGSQFKRDGLIVSLTTQTDKPPTPTYVAEVVQYDPNLDLAVIRITKTLDGAAVDRSKLNLPALPVGDSEQVELGDSLFIFGYPGIGGQTITFTSGNVSGFTSERGINGRAWIKTDATIAGGNSGGTGVNENGEIIGVPTRGGSGGANEVVDCRQITDTNGDGKIDDHDTCVPMGGFINALRPINLAKPLIEAATHGLGPKPTPQPVTPSKTTPSGTAQVRRLIFAPGVNDHDQPVSVTDSFPSGSDSIYFFFDYKNFQDGTPWFAKLIYNDGVYSDTWPVANWDGGASGTWWLSYGGGSALPDGSYNFALYYDNKEIGSATAKVGGTSGIRPGFQNISFSGDGEEGFLLKAGFKEAKATFDHANMTANTRWSYVWYFDGQKVAGKTGQPFSRSSGTGSLTLTSKKGFPSGTLRLELYIENKLAATSDLLIGGSQTSSGGNTKAENNLIGPITFASQVDKNNTPLDPGTAFASGISTLYGLFDYQGMQNGWAWTPRWSLNGQVVVNSSGTWKDGDQGKNYEVWVNSRSGSLPDGEYKLEILVRGQLVQTGIAKIGTGQVQPSPTTVPRNQGVQINGYILDADTGRGIPGALFIALKPGITVKAFQWTEEEVYSIGKADNTGYFELSNPLVRGEAYSMIIGAKGYKINAKDHITIDDNLESPYQITIKLQRSQ